MSPRSLFNVILKVIGIFFIKDILINAASLIPALSQMSKHDFHEIETLTLLILILEIIIYFLLTYVLLFKTNWVIDKLKLDKGFDQENFNLNIHRSTILSVIIIILGGIVIINAISLLVEQLIYYIRMKKENVPNTKIDYVILHAVKLLIGIFLIVYQRTLVNFIEYKRR